MKRILGCITDGISIRRTWFQRRKADGNPITWYRAMFSQLPRFGLYDQYEAGCPDHTKKDYAIVQNS